MNIRVIKGTELSQEEVDSLVRDLLAIRDKALPERMRKEYADGETFYRDQILDPETIMICAFNSEGHATAYLAAVPHSSIYAELKEHDFQLEDDPNDERYYVENIASLERSLLAARVVIELVRELARETDRRGRKQVAMHIRIENDLANLVTAFFPMEVTRLIPFWYYTEEPAYYMVAHIDKQVWYQKEKKRKAA